MLLCIVMGYVLCTVRVVSCCYAPCFIPKYVGNMSDNFPVLLVTYLLHEYVTFNASSKHVHVPSFIIHFNRCTRDTL